MKAPLLLTAALFISFGIFGQTAGPNNPGMATTVPSSACLACPGSIWSNETNVYLQDNTSAFVTLEPNGTCFQSSCYRSRYLYASNFGFNIPGTATISGITVDIFRQSGNTNSAADSTVKLVQNSVPAGANRAMVAAWPLTGAYYTYGSASDLWGLVWTPADINAATFGLYLKIYNMDANVTTTPSVDHIRITVDYTTSTGIHSSQTAEPSLFNVYMSEHDLQLGFVSDGSFSKASVGIYDQLGQLQMNATAAGLQEGMNTISIPGLSLPAGIYFVRLEAQGKIFTKKFIVQN